MLKWIGCIIIMVACGGIGLAKSKELQCHLDDLEELKKLIYLYRSELVYTRAPFAEVFEKIAGKVKKPYKKWLEQLRDRLSDKGKGTFCEIWCQSVDDVLPETKLKKDELEELKCIGKNLEYIESIDLYIEQLEYKIKNTREVYRSKQKLCRSMGIMGGIFLVILLL